VFLSGDALFLLVFEGRREQGTGRRELVEREEGEGNREKS